jgi:hypothetical protein
MLPTIQATQASLSTYLYADGSFLLSQVPVITNHSKLTMLLFYFRGISSKLITPQLCAAHNMRHTGLPVYLFYADFLYFQVPVLANHNNLHAAVTLQVQ